MIAGLSYFLTVFFLSMTLACPTITSHIRKRSGVFRAVANGTGVAAGLLLLVGLLQAVNLSFLYARKTSFGQPFGVRGRDFDTLLSNHVLLIILCLVTCSCLGRRLFAKSQSTLRVSGLCGLAASVACGATLYITLPRQGDEGLLLYVFLAPLLLLAIVLLLLTSLAVLAKDLYRHRRPVVTLPQPLCGTCQYNLTGNVSGLCPECGTPIDNSMRNALALPPLETQAPQPRQAASSRTVGRVLAYFGMFNLLFALPVIGAPVRLMLFHLLPPMVAHIILPAPIWKYGAGKIALWGAGLVSHLLFLLLVLGGYGLSRSRRWGRTLCLIWCALSIPLALVRLLSMPSPTTGISSIDRSQTVLILSILCTVTWELGIPMLVLTYLARLCTTADRPGTSA